MLFRFWVVAVFIALFWPSIVSAQDGSATIRCPRQPLNVKLYRRVLAEQVKASIDTVTYSNPRVKVNLRLLARDSSKKSVAFADVLNGLTLTQDGLTSVVSGSLSYADSCEYTFLARVKVTAVETATGARLRSINDSTFTITSSGNSVVRKVQSGS